MRTTAIPGVALRNGRKAAKESAISPSLAAYREMLRDLENGDFTDDVIGGVDDETAPNPFDKYDQPLADAERIPENESAAVALAGFINKFSAPPPADGGAWLDREGFRDT